MKSRILLIFSMILISVEGLFAFDTSKADSAYNNKNYQEAEALYLQAMEKEGVSAALLYNLGNIYYKLGKDGEAIVCYERARKLDPGNKAIKQNLTFLSNKIVDANKGELQGKKGNVEPDAESFVSGIYNMIALEHRSDSWAVFAVMAFILFLGSMAMYMFTPNVLARKTGFFSGLIFLGFTVIFLIFAFIGANAYTRQDRAVLKEYTTCLLETPDSGASPVSSPLHKGTTVKVLETKQAPDGAEWMKVKLNSENVGWVKKGNVELI